LAAIGIRIIAPMPGKGTIGIEVPNTKTEAVHLRDVLDCSDFKEARGGIPVGLGKDIAGKPVIIDIKVIEFGLRLFNSDGSVDTLAIIHEEVDTYNYELLVVRQGDVLVNPYINLALQPFVQAYLESKDQKDLIAGADYIIRTYDLPYSSVGTSIGGIARVVEK